MIAIYKVITLGSICSGHMYAEHKEHLILYLASFNIEQNAQQFLFPALKLAALASCICSDIGPMTVSMATWTEVRILILGGTARFDNRFYKFKAQLFGEF